MTMGRGGGRGVNGGNVGDPGAWEPLAGSDILNRLRFTGRARPIARPDLADHLRWIMEARLGPVATPAPGARLTVTRHRLTEALRCESHRSSPEHGAGHLSVAVACGALVGSLFRQLVTVGRIEDPMDDGMGALRAEDRSDLVAWIDGLPADRRSELSAEVERQAEALAARWPALAPGWLPRTQQSMHADLCSGTVRLSARVDLALGVPLPGRSSVGLLEVKSGSRRIEHCADRQFCALVETLRRGVPPFVVATYYTRTGELDVDPVSEDLLVAAALRVAAAAEALGAAGADGAPAPSTWAACERCAAGAEWTSTLAGPAVADPPDAAPAVVAALAAAVEAATDSGIGHARTGGRGPGGRGPAPVIETYATAAATTEAIARPARRSFGDSERQATIDTLHAGLPPRVARLAGTGRLFVDWHLLRVAVSRPEALARPDEPFRWQPAFVRRSLGLAVLAHCLDGPSSTPAQAAAMVADAAVEAWRLSGDRRFGWEPWMAGLGTGARATVLADAITWSTGALTAVDWTRLPHPVRVAPPDDVWSCGRGRRVVIRGRSEAGTVTRDGHPVIVLVCAGAPTRGLRLDLGLPALAAVLRAPHRPPPARVVGVWPDAGLAASVEVDGALLEATTRGILTAVDALVAAREPAGGGPCGGAAGWEAGGGAVIPAAEPLRQAPGVEGHGAAAATAA